MASIVGALAVAASPLLPWLRVGDVGLRGIPDPAGIFVLALGVVCLILSLAVAPRRKRHPFAQLLAAVAAVTTLAVVWRTAPGTVADRAQAHAQAVALVDNVPVAPVPPVSAGIGIFVGVAGGLVVATAALLDQVRRSGAGGN
jgi:hypothetical protein